MSNKTRSFLDVLENPTQKEAEKIQKTFIQMANEMKAIFTPAVQLAMKNKLTAWAEAAVRISSVLEQAKEKKDIIFDLLDNNGSIVDFMDLSPINGIELLCVLAEMDERTQEKARQIVSKANRDNGTKRLPAYRILKPEFQREYLEIRAAEPDDEEPEDRIVIARMLLSNVKENRSFSGKLPTERTVDTWLSEKD
ncbi:MAG TPA: hypothetical protein PLU16_15960 [Gallionellaceae bacterium]|jgi:hypothetical protein|nr:MAG: hypothetical protein B7X64_03115 [Halothiobacillus sp. 39-53-45]HQS76699.1 hypothetical protein [Gallionellaceae bacterium]